ncbi:hypothetical protein EX30DRAFT_32351 [Ascodesmis nigricans]|uniref:Uncharacterized protein n=1 Tax=Ascodesmis nigricans TaxID=341454 RepID=A0A4S2MWF0_9PEZI|nr:hypothetical protein EX30DRAFT_32351 [Ascodesmis nigricans]
MAKAMRTVCMCVATVEGEARRTLEVKVTEHVTERMRMCFCNLRRLSTSTLHCPLLGIQLSACISRQLMLLPQIYPPLYRWSWCGSSFAAKIHPSIHLHLHLPLPQPPQPPQSPHALPLHSSTSPQNLICTYSSFHRLGTQHLARNYPPYHDAC